MHIYNTGLTVEKRRLMSFLFKFFELGVLVGSYVALSSTVASLVQAGSLWKMLTKDFFFLEMQSLAWRVELEVLSCFSSWIGGVEVEG